MAYISMYMWIYHVHVTVEELFEQQAEKGSRELKGNAIKLRQSSTQV